MAASLITKLNHAFMLNNDPDAIVLAIRDPFSYWRRGNTMTLAEYAANRELPIVLLNETYWAEPERAECRHYLGSAGPRASYTLWEYDRHWRGWLGREYWMRSLASYEVNPDEPAPQS